MQSGLSLILVEKQQVEVGYLFRFDNNNQEAQIRQSYNTHLVIFNHASEFSTSCCFHELLLNAINSMAYFVLRCFPLVEPCFDTLTTQNSNTLTTTHN